MTETRRLLGKCLDHLTGTCHARHLQDEIRAHLAIAPLCDATGWLIEDRSAGHSLYMEFGDEPLSTRPDRRWPRLGDRFMSPLTSTRDADKAVRFARKEDAEGFVRVFRRFLLVPEVTEHCWPAIADRNPQGGDAKLAPSRSDESGGAGTAIAQRKVA